MTKHTAIKWYTQEQPRIHDEEPMFDVIDEIGIIRCQAMKEDAERIAKAINSHEALVEACKEAQSYILHLKGNEFTIKNSEYFHISVVINEALKLARKA